MKTKIVVRVSLAALFGGLFGRYMAFDYTRWHERGRDAFIAYQQHRFDKYMATQEPGSGIGWIVVTAIMAIGLAAVYELLANSAEYLLTRKQSR